MYKVMIVDDETIILSGIKFLVDWERNGCVICATARNGQEALKAIRQMPPDIILADIRMPVMDGISLLKQVNEEFPYIVFIMLTNLEEFDLARQALRFRAVDYLLKSRLEAVILENALKRAKDERDQRNRLMAVSSMDYFVRREKEELVNKALQTVIFLRRPLRDQHAEEILANNGLLTGYRYFYIPIDYGIHPEGEGMTAEEKAERLNWIKELAEKAADGIYKNQYVLVDTGQRDVLVMFVHHIRGDGKEKQELFRKKLASTVNKITQARCEVFSTSVYDGKEMLWDCAGEYQCLLEAYYLENSSNYSLSEVPERYEPLGLEGIGSQLMAEILKRNVRGMETLLDKAEARINGTIHQKSQAIWLLNELNRSASQAFFALDSQNQKTVERISSFGEIDGIKTRSQVISWIEMLKKTTANVIGSSEGTGNRIAEKAKKYVLSHLEEHVGLQETADYIGVSAGYLSTIFKREYQQSFVEFENRAKIEYACQLLEKKQMMITEIAYKLGFENAYYFSKVFRKYMGMSPTDYQRK